VRHNLQDQGNAMTEIEPQTWITTSASSDGTPYLCATDTMALQIEHAEHIASMALPYFALLLVFIAVIYGLLLLWRKERNMHEWRMSSDAGEDSGGNDWVKPPSHRSTGRKRIRYLSTRWRNSDLSR
jgi:hypothetical protein